jgi:hypothetical protein
MEMPGEAKEEVDILTGTSMDAVESEPLPHVAIEDRCDVVGLEDVDVSADVIINGSLSSPEFITECEEETEQWRC